LVVLAAVGQDLVVEAWALAVVARVPAAGYSVLRVHQNQRLPGAADARVVADYSALADRPEAGAAEGDNNNAATR
jgi:hypothetical protein